MVKRKVKVVAKKKKKKVVAKKVAAKKAPAKKKRAHEKKADSGSPWRPVGETTGLGVQGAWGWIFQRNEKCKKADRLCDKEISEWMYAEFPGRQSAVFKHVQPVRTKYNKGGLTKGVVPTVQSVQYEEGGKPKKMKIDLE